MAAIMATMAVFNARCSTFTSSKTPTPSSKPIPKPISLNLPLQQPHNAFPKGLSSLRLAETAVAGAVFSALSTCDAAIAVHRIAEIAEGGGGGSDNRGLALLLPIIPAIVWVLYNILQPALNQISRMRSTKALVIGAGGLAGLLAVQPDASAAVANEIAMTAAEAGSDNRGQLLLFVVAPAILWVLYNILQPALNQINRMRSQ